MSGWINNLVIWCAFNAAMIFQPMFDVPARYPLLGLRGEMGSTIKHWWTGLVS